MAAASRFSRKKSIPVEKAGDSVSKKKKSKAKTENGESNDNGVKYKSLVVDLTKYKTTLTQKYLNRKPYQDIDRSKINSFISGTIREIFVKEGDKIEEGDKILILEAMKMENRILAPVDGIIDKIHVSTDERVPRNTLLISIK